MYFIISNKEAPYEGHCWVDITGVKQAGANETMYFIISNKEAPYEGHCWVDITGVKQAGANETIASTCTHIYLFFSLSFRPFLSLFTYHI